MSATTSTPFPLAVFTGNPDAPGSAAEATFDANNETFDSLMGATPIYQNTYIDASQAPADWASNASYFAGISQTAATFDGSIPVIGLPMGSTNADAPSTAQILENFTDGTYDSMLQSMVKSWADAGFMTQYWRPGVEMNLGSTPGFVGGDASLQALWVSAFQNIYTVLHAAATADGVNLKVEWNPGTTNDSTAGNPTETLYPGSDYVDVIAADVYADAYPFGEGSSQGIYDWDKSGQVLNSANPVYDTSVTEWASDPVNLEHYYTDPASDAGSLDASGGSALSLQNIIDFAKAEGKPLAIAETGAGATGDGAGLSDNPTFVQWLSSTLTDSGVTIDYVSIWDSNGGGNYEFSNTSDDKPLEEAAWAKYFGAQSTAATPITITSATTAVSTTDVAPSNPFTGVAITDGNASQTETAMVTMSSATNGTFSDPNAATDGSTVASGIWSVSGSSTDVATALDALVFTPTANQVAAGDSVTTTLTATITDTAGETASTASTVTATQDAVASATPDTLALQISQDDYDGNAAFTVAVNGTQVGGEYSAAALNSSGDSSMFVLKGDWNSGVNDVQVTFINDASGSTTAEDRNLYVDSIAYNGVTYAGTTAALTGDGTDTFAVGGDTATAEGPADVLGLNLSEDAYEGNADFVLYIDGKAVTTPKVVTALHDANATQGFALTGDLGAGSHTIGIGFTNDASGATAAEDRNLYVDGITVNGSDLVGSSQAIDSNGVATFAFTTTH